MHQQLSLVLANARALYEHYQHAHWLTTEGYQHHLLFERLYENLEGEVDPMAEEFIGLYECKFDLIRQQKFQTVFADRWQKVCPDDLIERSIEAEKGFLHNLKQLYDDLEKSGLLTMGMDDLLMSTSKGHETHLYLLKQQKSQGCSCG